MTEIVIQNAIWTPGWYELDQTLVLGERQKYWFFQDPPEECKTIVGDGAKVDLVFFNQLDSPSNRLVRYAKVVEMRHPVLGELLRVDADGLDYIFFPVDGDEVVVNAEEEPGVTYDTSNEISEWSVIVKLTEVSEPMGELT